MSLDQMRTAGAIYQTLPPGYRMELLDTSRPNPNVPDFVRFLASRTSGSLGLAEIFATMDPTGGDFRSAQVLSWPAFMEMQKFLERTCDWLLYRFALWAARKNLLDYSGLPPRWLHQVQWQWPTMTSSDEQAHENALATRFRNLTGSYMDEFGSEWKQKLIQIRDEIDWCKANNVPHPSFAMLSGGERTGAGDGPGAEDLTKQRTENG